MPWCQIPIEKLPNIKLFGYDILNEDDHFIWAHGPKGRTCIDKAKPVVWFEDVGDAAQAGASAILQPDQYQPR
jgi:hypothetical protein